MNLLPQDVLVMLKLAVCAGQVWTYDRMAYELGMSPSMAYGAVRRAGRARLYDPERRLPRFRALEEFLVHGVKYAYPPDLGAVTRGVPTAFASPALRGEFVHDPDGGELFVWPHPEGGHRGVGLQPLYKSVPEIALRDDPLYAILGALDSVRIGRARERRRAEEYLRETLAHAAEQIPMY